MFLSGELRLQPHPQPPPIHEEAQGNPQISGDQEGSACSRQASRRSQTTTTNWVPQLTHRNNRHSVQACPESDAADVLTRLPDMAGLRSPPSLRLDQGRAADVLRRFLQLSGCTPQTHAPGKEGNTVPRSSRPRASWLRSRLLMGCATHAR